jgi:DNA gyrase subunit B
VGIKATNAFSAWLEVTVRRDGYLYRQRFEQGGTPTGGVQVIEPGSDRVLGEVGGKIAKGRADKKLGAGTSIHFRPQRDWFDPTMDWPKHSVPWDFERLATRLQQLAHLHPGVRIELADQRGLKKDHKRRLFHSQHGLVDYVSELNQGLTVLHQPIRFEAGQAVEGKGTISLEVVLQYAGDEGPALYSFVNSIPTPKGGTAVSGFQAGLTKAINQYAADKKLIKDSIRGDDLLLGLTAVISVKMSYTPQFSSQTKESLTSSEVQGVATSITYEHLLNYFNKNGKVAKDIVKQAEAAARGREAAKAARQLVIRKSALEVSELPGKLADVARDTHREQTMLYIVEGDSAGGSCKQARDRRYHAILPLRGKILNTEGATITKMIGNGKSSGGNSEVKALVSAIGGGIGADFNVETVRYGGIAILTDADVDGSHIRTLLYTLFWRHMRPLVEAGRVYLARAPLYLVKYKKEETYLYSEAELEAFLDRHGRKNSEIQRYKGLGEMNPAQLRQTVFALVEGANPTLNPHMYQVVVADPHHTGQTLTTLMGSSAQARKTWLLETWAGETAAQAEAAADPARPMEE